MTPAARAPTGPSGIQRRSQLWMSVVRIALDRTGSTRRVAGLDNAHRGKESAMKCLMLLAAVCSTAHAHIVPFNNSTIPSPSGAMAGPVELNTQIGDWLAFGSARPVWCEGDCQAPYDAAGYYGVRFQLDDDGPHFGWIRIGVNGSGMLGAVEGAYQDQANSPIPAGATDIVPPAECGSADFNCDGDPGTDQDITAFFACLSGVCPAAPCGSTADFDGDGEPGTDQDIDAFFRVLGGGHC